jgi:hypothetical protein
VSDVLGDMDSDPRAALGDYRKHVTNHFGEEKGGQFHELGRIQGQHWESTGGLGETPVAQAVRGGVQQGIPAENIGKAGPIPGGNGPDLTTGGQGQPQGQTLAAGQAGVNELPPHLSMFKYTSPETLDRWESQGANT